MSEVTENMDYEIGYDEGYRHGELDGLVKAVVELEKIGINLRWIDEARVSYRSSVDVVKGMIKGLKEVESE